MNDTLFLGGRLHPLLVHLPIGILAAAFLFELSSKSSRYKKLDSAVEPLLLIGAVAAVFSAVSGYLLSQEGGYEDRLLNTHRNFGIATAVFSVILYITRQNSTLRVPNKKKRKVVRIILFLPLMILLTITGHFGGTLTHGEEYLSAASAESAGQFIDPANRIKTISNINEAALYPEIIQPIFESYCYSCHSAKKQKGQLRLDGMDFILKGGKHGEVIDAGNADSSKLFSMLMLPLEDERHMPPNEKPQLSSAAIDLVRHWINQGASFDQKVASFENADKIIQSIRFIADGAAGSDDWIPKESTQPVNDISAAKLQMAGALVLPISAGSNYLSLSFPGTITITKETLNELPLIGDQLVSLRLSYVHITDQDMTIIAKLKQLRWLYLDHTDITDNASLYISELTQLRYLNVVGTAVSDQSLENFSSLKDLKKIYLFETNVSSNGITKLLNQLPELRIDTGRYQLPPLPGDTVIYKRKGV
jgi:uncharacterized membrane protein